MEELLIMQLNAVGLWDEISIEKRWKWGCVSEYHLAKKKRWGCGGLKYVPELHGAALPRNSVLAYEGSRH